MSGRIPGSSSTWLDSCNGSNEQLHPSSTIGSDGQPVRGIDCVASHNRWMVRDSFGQTLSTSVDEIKGGDKSFSIRLKEPRRCSTRAPRCRA